jgi:hypothetical protein
VPKEGTAGIAEFHEAMLLHCVCASYRKVGTQDSNFPAVVTGVVDSRENIHRLE